MQGRRSGALCARVRAGHTFKSSRPPVAKWRRKRCGGAASTSRNVMVPLRKRTAGSARALRRTKTLNWAGRAGRAADPARAHLAAPRAWRPGHRPLRAARGARRGHERDCRAHGGHWRGRRVGGGGGGRIQKSAAFVCRKDLCVTHKRFALDNHPTRKLFPVGTYTHHFRDVYTQFSLGTYTFLLGTYTHN